MVPFKPAEIRIIVALSVLALAGSVVTILQRQGHLSRLDIGAFSEKSIYNHSYSPKDLALTSTQSNQLAVLANVPEAKAIGEKININHCGLFDLESLPGIGPVLAERIMSFRDSVSGFQTVEDLRKVKGIGPAKFAAIKDKVVIK